MWVMDWEGGGRLRRFCVGLDGMGLVVEGRSEGVFHRGFIDDGDDDGRCFESWEDVMDMELGTENVGVGTLRRNVKFCD